MKLRTTLFLILLFQVKLACACVCFCPDFKKCYNETEFVFIGKVISKDLQKNIITSWDTRYPITVNFEVKKYIKGYYFNRKIITLFQPRNGCDASLTIDSTYLVFALKMGSSTLLQVKECSGTGLLSRNVENLKLVEGDTALVFTPPRLGVVDSVEANLFSKLQEFELLKEKNQHLKTKEKIYKYFLIGSIVIIAILIILLARRNTATNTGLKNNE